MVVAAGGGKFSAVEVGSVRMEIENDDFPGFVRGGFPLTFVHGFDGCLTQHGMASENGGGFNCTVGGDGSFNFY